MMSPASVQGKYERGDPANLPSLQPGQCHPGLGAVILLLVSCSLRGPCGATADGSAGFACGGCAGAGAGVATVPPALAPSCSSWLADAFEGCCCGVAAVKLSKVRALALCQHRRILQLLASGRAPHGPL
jgi:hypothetical protein